MTQIAAWFDQHHINGVTVVDTVAILVLASIIILVFSRLLRRDISSGPLACGR